MSDFAAFEERSPILAEEARILLANTPIKEIGRSDRSGGAVFHALGSFASAYLGREVYGGVKRLMAGRSSTKLEDYFKLSLANLLLIEELCPELREIMPLYMAGIVNGQGDYQSILMEDYSCGGNVRVREMGWFGQEKIPQEILPYMKPDADRDLALVFAFVGDEEKVRILDLNDVPWKKEFDERKWDTFFGFGREPASLEKYLVRV